MTFARARVRSRAFALLAALVVIWPVVFYAVANPSRVLAAGGLGANSTIVAADTAPSVDDGPTTITVTSIDGLLQPDPAATQSPSTTALTATST